MLVSAGAGAVPAARHAPPQRMGSLSLSQLKTMSAHIARLIEKEAAAELWVKRRSGVISPLSLYTADGQRTFEDIRRRYRADPAFQDWVNKYVGEFEHLLAKIGQTDGDDRRKAMLSDAGKVYLMLAHAAERIFG